MTSPLVRWVESPRSGHGVWIAEEAGAWKLVEYEELARAARRAAAQLRDAGLERGGVVCLVLPTGRSFIAGVFGTWFAGGTVSPIAPPLVFGHPDRYAAEIRGILASARPAVVLTDRGFEDVAASAMRQAGLAGRPLVLSDEPTELSSPHPADLALLQFTSGSSGRPRGVQIPFDSLDANIRMMHRWTRMGPEDPVASWLPLFHDMGFIGGMLTPIANQADLWIMSPEQFIRAPVRWLACFGKGHATVTAVPPFACSYVARRVRPESLEGLDFSGWHSMIVGAEPVDPVGLEAFAALLEPYGFSRKTFLPAYGLAEATLAVAGVERERAPIAISVDWETLRFGEPVRVLDVSELGGSGTPPTGGWLVGCGPPLRGVEVGIADEAGRRLPDGYLGEIVVRGPSVGSGYRGGDPGRSTRFVGRELRSGDAGFRHRGQLFIVGRIGDSLKIRGRSVYVEDLDIKLASATGLAASRIAVVSSSDLGLAGVVAFVEAKPGPWVGDAGSLLRRELGHDVPIRLAVGPRGLIQRTSSGKPRRRHMWMQLHAGSLEATTVWEQCVTPASVRAPRAS